MTERKLGVRSRKQAEKPTSWVQEEKNKRENPPRKLIDGERRKNWACGVSNERKNPWRGFGERKASEKTQTGN